MNLTSQWSCKERCDSIYMGSEALSSFLYINTFIPFTASHLFRLFTGTLMPSHKLTLFSSSMSGSSPVCPTVPVPQECSFLHTWFCPPGLSFPLPVFSWITFPTLYRGELLSLPCGHVAGIAKQKLLPQFSGRPEKLPAKRGCDEGSASFLVVLGQGSAFGYSVRTEI